MSRVDPAAFTDGLVLWLHTDAYMTGEGEGVGSEEI